MQYSNLVKPLCIAVGTALLFSCAALRSPEPWPLQSETEEIYRFYEGPEVPMEELAVLR